MLQPVNFHASTNAGVAVPKGAPIPGTKPTREPATASDLNSDFSLMSGISSRDASMAFEPMLPDVRRVHRRSNTVYSDLGATST